MFKTIEIDFNDICNLSLIPTPMSRNPLRLICELILQKDKNVIKKSLDLLHSSQCSIDPNNANIFLPWIHYKSKHRDTFLDVYLNKENKIKKIKKLQNLITSIQTLCYKPDLFPTRQRGFITGYFLQHKSVKKFYIMSGNHRVAALTALFPNKKISVALNRFEFLKTKEIQDSIFEKNKACPTIFDSKNVSDWPAVSSKYITAEKAVNILKKYFQ